MINQNLASIFRKTRKELKTKNILREKMLVNSRKITQQSKGAIFLVQRNILIKAQKKLEMARSTLQSTFKLLETAPELMKTGALFNASQEYAEAVLFLNLEKSGVYLTPEEVGVSSDVYILGLADVVGELRRKVLDSIKNGDAGKAEKYFKYMETIYGELVALNEYVFSILPGLRRKCDVARHLVELTEGEVMMEKRRSRLEEYLRLVEKGVSKQKK